MVSDILEQAKAVDPEMLAVLNWGALRDLISGLIAEVERLRSLENCVSLVIDRQGKTNAALLGQLDVISAYLDAELVEWKNGDQIAEIAIKFMDLQKQKLNDANSQIAAKDARIKELEADRIEARAQYLLFMNDNPGCIAWNFDELDETEQDALREQARYMLELEEPWAYIQLREAREQIKRLEAAFLKLYVNQLVGCNMPREVAEKQACDALKRIKEEREG